MLYNYIAIIFFTAFAFFIPYSLLLTSRILRHNSPGNPVKNAPYESAEETVGSGMVIHTEYLPIFALFLPFEVLSLLLLVWAYVAKSAPYTTGIYMLSLLVVAMLFGLAAYRYIGDKNV
ncbi:MAG: NADH-quinone oxidoreductase subunit A [Candidatus Marsarchaeota archaeon]|jgi:NADH:ubiquinone oxidoreductase subunit 3 (subunit A)|nr:NADH-quinone oxidoreductase subunit A [Candidatus Marsarchaeota archaeon]